MEMSTKKIKATRQTRVSLTELITNGDIVYSTLRLLTLPFK